MEYIKFEDFIDSTQYGYTAETTSLSSGDAKYLRITDIVPYYVDKDRVPFCDIDSSKIEKYLVHNGDVLIARTGATTGYNLVVDESFDNFIFASYLIRFNYNRKKLVSKYLKYVLKSPSWYGFVNNHIGGSAQPGMNARVFGKFYLPYTDIPTQQKIASILSAYDSRIENNRKRIKLLEQMAENLYKEWFVRFRFPGYESAEFEGGVPKGWSVERMRNIAKISAGGDAPKDMSETYSEAYPFPIYSNGIKDEGLYGYCKRFTIPENTITVSARGTVGYVAYREEPFLPIVRLISIHSFIKGISPYWLFFCLRNDSIDGYGTSQQQITVPFFEKKKVIVPSQNVQMLFENQISPIYSERRQLKKQIKLLTTQRDLLLPRLMSGKLGI